jgi:hypothetical protein
MSAVLEVVSPGAMASIQDLGRPGLRRLGVPHAGALEPAGCAWPMPCWAMPKMRRRSNSWPAAGAAGAGVAGADRSGGSFFGGGDRRRRAAPRGLLAQRHPGARRDAALRHAVGWPGRLCRAGRDPRAAAARQRFDLCAPRLGGLDGRLLAPAAQLLATAGSGGEKRLRTPPVDANGSNSRRPRTAG